MSRPQNQEQPLAVIDEVWLLAATDEERLLVVTDAEQLLMVSEYRVELTLGD